MKKYFVLVLLLIHGISFSQPVDISLAKKISKNFYKTTYQNGVEVKGINKLVKTDSLEIKSAYVKTFHGHNSYYVTNFKNGGWVITSSHKSIGPILAHSPTGSINEDDIRPSVFEDWMSQYDIAIDSAYIQNKHSKNKQDKWDKIEKDSIKEEPSKLKTVKYESNGIGFWLIDTEWNQKESNDAWIGQYSNKQYFTNDPSAFIPAYNAWLEGTCSSTYGATSANFTGGYFTGCVATAIGQIMKYWEYACGDYADFDWWNMPPQLYSFDPNFDTQRYAVSYLLKRIGDRVGMHYGCDKSWALTKDGKDCLKDFDYNNGDMDYKLKIFYTYNQWVDLLKVYLDRTQPILYGTDGHSIVCDGYRHGTDEFHFNLGWGGNYDGFFDFEDVETAGILTKHDFIGGIHPNWRTDWLRQNIEINTSTSDQWPNKKTYQAKSMIIAGDNTIFNVGSGSDCRLLAFDYIDLKPGFWAKPGSTLLVKHFANTQGTLKSYENEITENDSINENPNFTLLNSKFDISVYPNPSLNGIFSIQSKNNSFNDVTITIYDILGQKVYSSFEPTFFSKIINLSKFSKGIYTICISNKSNNVNIKIINE